MKNTYLIRLLILSLFALIACRDDDEIRFPELQEGANLRVVPDPDNSFIDFTDLENSSYAFDVYSINENLQKVEFFVSYYDISADSNYAEVVAETLTAADFENNTPRVTLTAGDLAGLFDLPGGAEDLGGADLFNFRTVVTLTDGRVFEAANSAPSITAGNNPSFTALFQTFVGGCESNLDFTGTWTGVTPAGPFGPSFSNTNVQITPIEGKPGFYNISDISGGGYFGCCASSGFKENQPVQIEDICGTLFIRTSTGSQVSFTTSAANGAGPGTYDGVSDTFTMPWFDATNGFASITTFTRN